MLPQRYCNFLAISRAISGTPARRAPGGSTPIRVRAGSAAGLAADGAPRCASAATVGLIPCSVAWSDPYHASFGKWEEPGVYAPQRGGAASVDVPLQIACSAAGANLLSFDVNIGSSTFLSDRDVPRHEHRCHFILPSVACHGRHRG